jgi:tetratricopeptide (TPR) repeat protein
MVLASCGGNTNHAEAGKLLLEQKQYDKALSEFNEAVQQDPKNYYAYFGQGFAYNNTGHPDLALASANKALELKPDDAGSHFVRGSAEASLNQANEAVADLNEAIQSSRNTWLCVR